MEQQKCNHNYLDNPISLDEVEKAAKMLKYKKSPGPDRIRNEMLKTGIFYLKTSICNLFNLILKVVFSLVYGVRALLPLFTNPVTHKTLRIIEEFA